MAAQVSASTGPLAPIAVALAVASVLGTLAAGFVEAQALEHGTQFVDKEGRFGAGVDKVPAISNTGKRYRLNRGEAVIPTDKNAAYRDVIDGIFKGTVNPETANTIFKMLGNGGGSAFDMFPQKSLIVIENKEGNGFLRKMAKSLKAIEQKDTKTVVITKHENTRSQFYNSRR